METEIQNAQVVRFATFEVDLRAGELRKGGIKLKLGGQPFQVLAILLERPGELVTREELQKRLWPDSFVDVDHNLNTAINKIRDVLGDSAENPRFVETLARRGYRFIRAVNGTEQPRVVEVKPSRGLRSLIFPVAFGLLAVFGITAVLLSVNLHGWRDRLFAGPARPQIRALAVLPLANLSGDAEQEYFADGMTEALITELGKISVPRVISRQSIMQYKGSKKPLSEIARELNVDAVLEGTVERSGDRVRVIVRMGQVSPEGQLWSNQYNRDIRDLLRLQDEIARAVTDEVQIKLKPRERARLASSRPVDPGAQDDYFRALHFRNNFKFAAESVANSEQDLPTAITYFRQATEKDANYGPAYVGMAQAYIDLGQPYGGYHDPKETLPPAKAAATRAVEVDPMLGEAHFVLAQTLELYDWNWYEAERQYKLALELSPNYAPAHMGYGRFVQAIFGRNDEAMKQTAYAAELNPRDPQIRLTMGFVTYAARQYDSAIVQFKELNAASPGLGDFGLGWSYREKKMYPEAIAALEKALAHSRHPSVLASVAAVYGLAGRKGEALKLIDELKEKSRQHYIPASHFAVAYSGLGEDETMTWL